MKEDNEMTFEINRKRKFQAEQLDLPQSKYKCCERSLSYDCDSLLRKPTEVEYFRIHTINGKPELGTSDDGSEPESAKDSNSFVADSDCYGEAKFETEYAKTCAYYDQPSTSSANWGGSSCKNTLYSLESRDMTNMGAGKEQINYMVGGHNPHRQNAEYQAYHNLEEHFLEIENLVHYSCSEYGNDEIEECKEDDEEPEDMLYSNEVNPNIYVLSSGRWSVSREGQLAKKKPTIDQEFEQYFSTLML